MKLRALLTLVILLSTLACVAQAQTPVPDAAAPFRSFYHYTRQNLIRAAEKMPAEHFGFKPTSDVRSFAEIFGHIAQTNYQACAGLRGEANPNKDELEKTVKSKEEVVKAVKASFEYCDAALKNLTEANLKETVKAGTREIPKTSPLVLLSAHGQEHYGNLVTYMRLQGVVPPSSEAPPVPAKK